jgi:N4-gp56 family major capsid protein
MTMQTYQGAAGRLANKVRGEIIAHAMPVEVLGITGSQKQMPKQQGGSVVFRRWLPWGSTATAPTADNRFGLPVAAAAAHTSHVVTEGVTPTADSMTPEDVTVAMVQYAVLYGITDKAVDLDEDGGDMPDEMKKMTGERVGLIREMARMGQFKTCTNAFYSGGTTEGTVDEKLTLNVLRKAARSIKANHGKTVTSILAPSASFNTSAIEASFIAFCHTDVEPDIRDLPGFVSVAAYGSRKPIHDNEIGSVENFRFVTSPDLVPVNNAGALTGSTGLKSLLATSFSSAGTKVDVYPIFLVGDECWGQVALRGMNAVDPTYIKPGTKSSGDPLGQRGYVGAKFYFAATMLNDGWGAVIYAGVTDI